MKIMMCMTWEGVTPELYEEARKRVKWDTDVAVGGVLHVASFSKNALHVTDIWESAEAMNSFLETRLLPGVAPLGIPTQPSVQVYPLHALFAPSFGVVEGY